MVLHLGQNGMIFMKEELSIDIVGLAGACSYALDCIEAELVNIKNKLYIIMNTPMELVLFKKSGMKFHCLQGLFILQIPLIL